jgi:malate dehydrogenase
MATVCIVGAGELGGAVAHALARGERVRRVTLIDAAATVAAGKALDMQQSGAVEGFHTQLSGTDDITRVTGCAVCVIADRAGQPRGEWSGEEGLALMARLTGYLGTAPVVFAGASQTPLLLAASREAGFDRERLVGSAAEAFAAAATAIVALEARCSPNEVMLAVLGAPASSRDGTGPSRAGFVVPWSEASIGGYALERVLTQVQLARLENRLARLWPPGPYALGLAAARVSEAIVVSSRRTFNLLSVLGGEFGIRGRVGSLPAWVSPRGIARVRVPTLNPRELVQIETALS